MKQRKQSQTQAVLDEWCQGRKKHTVGELLDILITPGLVDNQEAAMVVTNLLRRAGHTIQVCNFFPFIKIPS